MAPQPAPPPLSETGCPLADVQRRWGSFLYRAAVQALLGRHDRAAAFRAEADRAQAVLDPLRGAAAARPVAALN